MYVRQCHLTSDVIKITTAQMRTPKLRQMTESVMSLLQRAKALGLLLVSLLKSACSSSQILPPFDGCCLGETFPDFLATCAQSGSSLHLQHSGSSSGWTLRLPAERNLKELQNVSRLH